MRRNHRVRAVSLFLAALMLLVLLPGAAESFPYVAYATDAVRLRARPSSSATILAVIRKGDAVLVTGADGNYKIVEYEGQKGFVVSAFLDLSGQSQPAQNKADSKQAAKYSLLSAGNEGAAVKALQEALQELGFYGKNIDSKFGSGTTQAVKDFQQKNNLQVNGSADAGTLVLLFEGTPKNSRGRNQQVKTLPPIAGTTIRPGNRGDAVREVQEALQKLGFYKGKIDGVFGTGSQEAAKAFQKSARLNADGLIGDKTFAALAQALLSAGKTTPPQAEVTAAPTTVPNPVFSEQPLPEATYPYNTFALASVNLRKRASITSTRFTTVPQGATVEVLEDAGNFLKVNYKKYTGYVAKEYINIPEQYLEGKVLDTNQSARVNYATLVSGDEGRAVRALQHALTELGFYAGGIDGKFGAGTTAGLKSLQKKNGLRETGIALPELQQLIYEKRVRNSKNRLVFAKTLPPLDNITLQEGDFGDAILALHEMLIQSGHYDSNPGLEFTRATSQAVKAFQKAHSIKVTGKVDAFTMLALKTAIKAQAPVTEQPQRTEEPLTQDNVVVIRDGTSGLAVTKLQARLVELKYYNIKPDGLFNADDVAALRHFQRVNSLPVTGIADLTTQQTLYTAYALPADATSLPEAGPQPTDLLKIGAKGDQVRALQSRLITLAYLTGSIDGLYGTQTAKAITNFQRMNSLKQDGIAGKQTLEALYSGNAKANQAANQGSSPVQPETPAAPLTTLKVGSTGKEVTALQQRLIVLKYFNGSADGIYGPLTFLAVKEFQAKNKLDADGLAGSLTLAKLNSALAIANTPSTPQVPETPVVPSQPEAPSFRAPKASEVRYANWYKEIRPIAQRLRDVVIYDFMSGEHYNFRFFSLGKHADGTTRTANDTAVMNKVLGEKNWTARPVWVIFSDGRVYMASTHSHPHDVDYIPGNDLNGHLCVHFPREMEEAAATGPYAVSHQNAILAGWDLTQNMAK